VPTDAGWEVRKPGARRGVRCYRTDREAIDAAQLMLEPGDELLVFNSARKVTAQLHA
jgi:hypothetical protein